MKHQVIRKEGLVRELMQAAVLNHRFPMQTNSPISEDGATWDVRGWTAASGPSFRGQADCPARGSCSWDFELKPVFRYQ